MDNKMTHCLTNDLPFKYVKNFVLARLIPVLAVPVLLGQFLAQPLQAQSLQTQALKRQQLQAAVREFVFQQPAVAYHPRRYSPQDRAGVPLEQIRQDLKLLKTYGFRSIVTYSAEGTLGEIPQIARELGFDGAIIMGLWDVASSQEQENAIKQRDYVDGYCVGNEGLGLRYSVRELETRMQELRSRTRRPVTTTEPIDRYLTGEYSDWLMEHSDWLFPLAHPIWSNEFEPSQAVAWISAWHDYLRATSAKQLVLKEVGFPSAGSTAFSEKKQLEFFQRLKQQQLSYFYFEAFDQPWKRTVLRLGNVEAHWGIFNARGKPKQTASWFLSNR